MVVVPDLAHQARTVTGPTEMAASAGRRVTLVTCPAYGNGTSRANGPQRAVPTTDQLRGAQSVSGQVRPAKPVEKVPMKRVEVVKVPSSV